MRTEEFIASLSGVYYNEEDLKKLRASIPLGRDEGGNLVLSQKSDRQHIIRHTCVTGTRRTAFIKRLVITLSCLYNPAEANFLILSPKMEYGELLRLEAIDATVPFVRVKSDLESGVKCIRELVELHIRERGCPRLILVLDGLEDLPDCNKNADFEEYRAIFDIVARQPFVDIITGADLMKSIFSGSPGAFVGIGNCLVTTRESGKADVTYVGEDSSLSLPTRMDYPDSPEIAETVTLLNAMGHNGRA